MKTFAIFASSLLLAATPAAAASLMTSTAGYSGPTLDIGSIGQPFYVFTAGPVALPGGITYTAASSNSVIGSGGYVMNDNGISTDAIIGTNSGSSWIDLTFSAPVAMFGGGFNYARINGAPVGNNPVISAFDSADNLIASFDLHALAPISTPGGLNAYAFRGIDGEGQMIKRFRMEGSYVIMSATTLGEGGVVPEPATWAMMIAGFGLVGAAARRRRSSAATA
jgi:hypothetical protein